MIVMRFFRTAIFLPLILFPLAILDKWSNGSAGDLFDFDLMGDEQYGAPVKGSMDESRRYCTVLYYAVLYCTILYCTVLYCTFLIIDALCCILLYSDVTSCHVLFCTLLHCDVTLCATLHSTALHCSAV